MDIRRIVPLAVFAVGVLAVAVEPALAQSTADSATEELIWDLNNQLLYIAVPLTILVEVILFYTVWRFRNNESPLPTRENRRLEISWTVATAVILLFVGVASYQVLASPYVTATSADAGEDVTAEDEAVLEVQVVAQKYYWTFNYNGTAANTSQQMSANNTLSTSGTLVIPADRPVRFSITSTDWLHAFHVPALGLKQDAMPGQHNTIQTKVTETGTYQLYCAEYCGSGHSQMLGKVRVVSQNEYQNWIDEQQSS